MAKEMGEVLGECRLLLGALPPLRQTCLDFDRMLKQKTQIVWFKRDLRLTDHRPLAEAALRGTVLPLYIIEPDVIHASDFDAMHWQFIAESLHALRGELAARGSQLIIEQGSAVDVFTKISKHQPIESIWAHEETGNALTFARDKAVAAWAQNAGIAFQEYPQNGVVRRLHDRDGWARQWELRMRQPVTDPPQALPQSSHFRTPITLIPSARDLGLTIRPERDVDLRGGSEQGWKVLQSFLDLRGWAYHREISSPLTAYNSCSRISPYLAWGCLSMREVVTAARAAAGGTISKRATSAFLSRCHWHCHFMQKLESEPAIESYAFNRACDDLRKRGAHPNRLAAWQAGLTGYPFLDACMRALKARGWINFRMRAMLVSFAAYHLWLDWRDFKDWLACQFIDYEPGIHISQIQMQSGLTGINTLRIYNPIKQGHDHDPEGQFIRRWVPELARIPVDAIHEPWKLPYSAQAEAKCRLGVDYPLPIVDHKEAVKAARTQFGQLRKKEAYWDAARQVMERHGSRKSRERRSRPRVTNPKPDRQTEFNLS